MFIEINRQFVMFSAIESMRFDPETKHVVIRTVSGVEHSRDGVNAEVADKVIREIILKMALASE